MAQTILSKRSNVLNKVPTSSQIVDGEIALNTNNGISFMLRTPRTPAGVGTATITEIGSILSGLSVAAYTGSPGDGSASIGNNITVGGNANIAGDLRVDGNTDLNGDVDVAGALTGTTANFSGALTGTTANFSGALTGTTANFSGVVNANAGISLPSGQSLSTDSFTLNGTTFTNSHKFVIKNSAGTILKAGWLLDTDSNSSN